MIATLLCIVGFIILVIIPSINILNDNPNVKEGLPYVIDSIIQYLKTLI